MLALLFFLRSTGDERVAASRNEERRQESNCQETTSIYIRLLYTP
jgi:hypothetical protein